MEEASAPGPAARGEPAPRAQPSRAVLKAGAVTVLAALVTGPGSAVTAKAVPLSRTAVEAELDTAAAEAGVHKSGTTVMALMVAADEESERPDKECAIAWAAAQEDGAEEYADVQAALGRHGWTTLRRGSNRSFEYVDLGKGGWSVTVTHDTDAPSKLFPSVSFTATAPAC
jgi:hypothetical protein